MAIYCIIIKDERIFVINLERGQITFFIICKIEKVNLNKDVINCFFKFLHQLK